MTSQNHWIVPSLGILIVILLCLNTWFLLLAHQTEAIIICAIVVLLAGICFGKNLADGLKDVQ